MKHNREYFESTLPNKPAKLHPRVKWASISPRTGSRVKTAVMQAPPSRLETVVSLSHATQDNNASYAAYSQTGEPGCFPMNDDDNDDDITNELDVSMATYGSKSPE
jgi:hypothetical protein